MKPLQRNSRYLAFSLGAHAILYLLVPLYITVDVIRKWHLGAHAQQHWSSWLALFLFDIYPVTIYACRALTAIFQYRTTFTKQGVSQWSFKGWRFLAWQDVRDARIKFLPSDRGGRSENLGLYLYYSNTQSLLIPLDFYAHPDLLIEQIERWLPSRVLQNFDLLKERTTKAKQA